MCVSVGVYMRSGGGMYVRETSVCQYLPKDGPESFSWQGANDTQELWRYSVCAVCVNVRCGCVISAEHPLLLWRTHHPERLPALLACSVLLLFLLLLLVSAAAALLPAASACAAAESFRSPGCSRSTYRSCTSNPFGNSQRRRVACLGRKALGCLPIDICSRCPFRREKKKKKLQKEMRKSSSADG